MVDRVAPFTVTRLIQELQTKPGSAVVMIRHIEWDGDDRSVPCSSLEWDSGPGGETVTLSDE